MNVLVLNADYQAITICSYERAVILVLQGKAQLVEKENNKFFNSQFLKIEIPSVIRIKKYVNVPYKKVHLSRVNIFKRDNYRCGYCGSTKDLTIDHIVPKSKGGTHTWRNVVTCCKECNFRKSDSLLENIPDMKLQITPYRPNYIMFVTKSNKKVKENWKPYLYL